jgi:Protein of unknown function (DUF3052)
MALCSTTPLVKKLGIRAGDRLRVENAPANYLELVAPLPEGVRLSPRFRREVNVCHFFGRNESDLRRALPRLLEMIRQDGCIWVSWPKRASGVSTDVTEDTIRAVAFPLGLVDIKVCAVDDTWSGLKLVIRKEHRMKSAGSR